MISRTCRRRLMKLAIKSVQNKVDGETNGLRSYFNRIAESWGVKFSDCGFEYSASTYVRQRRAWRLGIAPFCFGFFSVRIGEDKYFGYIVQLVEVANDLFIQGRYVPQDAKDYIDRYPNMRVFRKQTWKKTQKICNEKLRIHYTDDHTGNYGRLRDRWVIIDWGDESMNINRYNPPQ